MGLRLLLILAQYVPAHALLWDGPQETSALGVDSQRIEPTGALMSNIKLFKPQT